MYIRGMGGKYSKMYNERDILKSIRNLFRIYMFIVMGVFAGVYSAKQQPVYQGTLVADSTNFGGRIHLAWDAHTETVDSIRIWYNKDTIPLEYIINLPVTQSKHVSPTTKTIDTISGLDNDTLYFFGLQICKGGLWSYITEKSRTSIKTSLGDTSAVPNIIAIDSCWFEDSTNSCVVAWHVNTLEAPGNRTYQEGCVISLDPAAVVDTTQTVMMWNNVTQKQNITKINLYPDIVFDTTYAAGLWLRGYSSTLGPGRKSPPTDSSICQINIPPFTWEEIVLFPDNKDTVWAANEKIVMVKFNPFTLVDTIWSFTPGQLPVGFVQVGGVYFNLGHYPLEVPPFIIGMKYDNLPPGISEKDIGLYQYINGQLHVMHGFNVADGAVWDTVYKENLAYPFLILADTLSPQITAFSYTDTVLPKIIIPTMFHISDNSSNVFWQFYYGSGNQGYSYYEKDYLTSQVDSIKTVIKDTANVINESFGVRALFIASDGVNVDTVNVSRCVRTAMSEVITVVNMEWIPLRSCAGLDEPELETIFNSSIIDPDPWEYDNTKYRIFRWYNPDPLKPNSWLEYADNIKGCFDFIPGRIIWCKTLENHAIYFGSGVTVTLKEPYKIDLKPKSWTDFSNPFQFPIMLRDILEATGPGADSIEIYHWQKSSSTYEAMDIYIAYLDTIIDVTDTINSQQKHDAYTVYNYSSTSFPLRFPPISLPLSKYAGMKPDMQFCNSRYTSRNTRGTQAIDISDLPVHPDANPIIFQVAKGNGIVDFTIVNGRLFYSLPTSEPANLTFALYAVSGRKIWEKQVKGAFDTGKTVMNIGQHNGKKIMPASGMYIMQMEIQQKGGVKNFVTKKMLVVEQ